MPHPVAAQSAHVAAPCTADNVRAQDNWCWVQANWAPMRSPPCALAAVAAQVQARDVAIVGAPLQAPVLPWSAEASFLGSIALRCASYAPRGPAGGLQLHMHMRHPEVHCRAF